MNTERSTATPITALPIHPTHQRDALARDNGHDAVSCYTCRHNGGNCATQCLEKGVSSTHLLARN